MKKKLVLIGILTIILIPKNIYALSGNIIITCDKTTLNKNEMTICNISGENFKEEVSSIHAKINIDDNVSLVSINKDSTWEGAVSNGIIDVYTDTNKTGNFNITSIKIEAKNDKPSKIVLNEILLGDSKFIDNKFSEASVSINSTDEIKSIPASQETITPNNNNNEYKDKKTTNPKTGNFKIIVLVIILIAINISSIILIIERKKIGDVKK